MEGIKTFVITLVSTLIFITAVELIAPNNGFKKYLKFILGLILVAVILNPIVSIFTKGEQQIANIIDEFTNAKETSIEATKDPKKVDTIQEKVFRENLEKNINELLVNNFQGTTFTTKIDAKITLIGEAKIDIQGVFVTMDDGSIKKVEEVVIGEKPTTKKGELTESEREVRKYLKDELKINESKIIINNKR